MIISSAIVLVNCKGWYLFKNPPDWWASREYVVATTTRVFHNPETGFRYVFYVNNIKYESGYDYYFNNEGVVVGSKFKIAYNPKNPNENQLLPHEQILEENEGVGYTVGEHFGTLRFFFDEDLKKEIITIRYRFFLDGRKYTGIYNYYVNDWGLKREDISRKKFKVKYWKRNPYRAIILLDEPIEEGQ